MAADVARQAAVDLVQGVTARGESLSEQMAAGALRSLGPAERAAAQRLASLALRHWQGAQRLLKPHLRKGPPPLVDTILRLAVVELAADGAAAHGVVNEAVALVRAGGRRGEGFAGLVNAVLRRVAADIASGARLPPDELPGWLRGRLMSAWGKRAVLAIEAAHAAGAPLDLTPRAPTAADSCARTLGAELMPTGTMRLSSGVQVSGLLGYAEGAWWVQDAAAALPARALHARPGERVLDLCAAPGGKTLQLAAAGAEVTAVDISAPRMERVAENLKRCGLPARLVVADALEWQPERPFDAVLLDAPCSATGTIRRHPDLPFVKSPEMLRSLVALQAALIDRAVSLLVPGGRLVYATCSLLPDEGERQVAAALLRHPGLAAEPAALALPGVETGWLSPEGGLRLRPDYWPDTGGMDGFYIAVLRLGPAQHAISQ